jgi:hypothetical protein
MSAPNRKLEDEEEPQLVLCFPSFDFFFSSEQTQFVGWLEKLWISIRREPNYLALLPKELFLEVMRVMISPLASGAYHFFSSDAPLTPDGCPFLIKLVEYSFRWSVW